MAADAETQIVLSALNRTGPAFEQVERSLTTFKKQGQGVASDMTAGFGAITRALAPLTAAFSAVAVAQKIWSASMGAGELGEQAEQLGVSTDLLQAYRFAAAQVGVSVEQLDGGLMKLTKAMGSANSGSDEMIARFSKLGVKLLDVDGNLRKPSAVLPELSRGLLKLSSETERNSLMMELFGRSGARMVTMLETWAGGNDKATESARKQGAIISGDVIMAWDNLDDQIKTANAQLNAFIATTALPIATFALEVFKNKVNEVRTAIGLMSDAYAALDKFAKANPVKPPAGLGLTGLDRANNEVKILTDSIAAMEQQLKGDVNSRQTTARLNAQIAAEKELLNTAKQRLTVFKQADMESDEARARRDKLPVVWGDLEKPDKGGAKDPVGDKSKKSGAGLESALQRIEEERKALDAAAKFLNSSTLASEKELTAAADELARIGTKTAGMLKGLDPDSATAKRIRSEVTELEQARTAYNRLNDSIKLAFATEEKYGNGKSVHTETVRQLNAALDTGRLTTDAYNAAMKSANETLQDADLKARGAKGGVEGLVAGMEDAANKWNRANGTFEQGAKLWGDLMDGMDQAISDFATGAEVNFAKVVQSFFISLAQMEARAAVTSLWKAAGGASGILDFLGLGAGAGTSTYGSFASVAGSAFFGGPRAEGGPVAAGTPYLVGERGKELFVPDVPGVRDMNALFDLPRGMGLGIPGKPSIVGERGKEIVVPDVAGTIYNKQQIAGLAGGRDWSKLFDLPRGMGLGIPGRAGGGPVEAGRPYLVGERGRELFDPDVPGTVFSQQFNLLPRGMGLGIPSRDDGDSDYAGMGSLGGGSRRSESVVVNQNNYFGSDVSRSELGNWAKAVKQDTLNAVIDERRRGGRMKTAFR